MPKKGKKEKKQKQKTCVIEKCPSPATTLSYCRYHYIANWYQIKYREKLIANKKLESYIQEVVKRHPGEYREIIRRDIQSEKDVDSILHEMDIDDTTSAEEIDEILKGVKSEQE